MRPVRGFAWPVSMPCSGRRAAAIARLTLAASVAVMLFIGSAANAQIAVPVELLAAAQPAGMSVYLEARVVGADTYVCGMTDAMAWAWFPQSSEAMLSDARNSPAGRYSSRITIVAPRMSEEAIWQDASGGKVVANRTGSGQLSAVDRRTWQRFEIQSREGEGSFAAARTIIRISTSRTNRPAEPCDRTHSGTRVNLAYEGTDLFMK